MTTRSRTKKIGRSFGYSDDDLTTPGHDALVLWTRDNMKELLEGMVMPPLWEKHKAVPARLAAEEKKRYQREMDKRTAWLESFKKNGGDPTVPSYCPYKEPSPIETLPPLEGPWFKWIKPEIERPIVGGWIDVFTYGTAYTDYWTVEDAPRYRWGTTDWCFAVEVKTSIPSFGELLRQLRVYRDHVGKSADNCHVCVVSPDGRFADDIRDQGYLFRTVDLTAPDPTDDDDDDPPPSSTQEPLF